MLLLSGHDRLLFTIDDARSDQFNDAQNVSAREASACTLLVFKVRQFFLVHRHDKPSFLPRLPILASLEQPTHMHRSLLQPIRALVPKETAAPRSRFTRRSRGGGGGRGGHQCTSSLLDPVFRIQEMSQHVARGREATISRHTRCAFFMLHDYWSDLRRIVHF